MKCNQCNTDFEGKFCPNCGMPAESERESFMSSSHASSQSFSTKQTEEKNRGKIQKPFYKKWWFIVIVIAVVISIIAGIIGSNKDEGEKFKWDDIVMKGKLPEPRSKIGKIYSNTEELLSIKINKTSSSDYSEYVKECKKTGFTIDEEKESTSFEAYNKSGYKISINFLDVDDAYMIMELDAPLKMYKIEWPASIVGKLLPVPKSKIGFFSYEYDDSFEVYIGETSKADYSDYVSACFDKGFNVDYDKGETYYNADNSEGYDISIEYEGNNIMSISISSPDDEKEDSSIEEETSTDDEDESAEPSESEADLVDGMHADFKEAMDSYEKFIDEYIAPMDKYAKSDGTDATILSDYATYMIKYAEFVDKFEQWESKDLNTAETAYYLEVQLRVENKLLNVAP